jgi:hypothetical protein
MKGNFLSCLTLRFFFFFLNIYCFSFLKGYYFQALVKVIIFCNKCLFLLSKLNNLNVFVNPNLRNMFLFEVIQITSNGICARVLWFCEFSELWGIVEGEWGL